VLNCPPGPRWLHDPASRAIRFALALTAECRAYPPDRPRRSMPSGSFSRRPSPDLNRPADEDAIHLPRLPSIAALPVRQRRTMRPSNPRPFQQPAIAQKKAPQMQNRRECGGSRPARIRQKDSSSGELGAKFRAEEPISSGVERFPSARAPVPPAFHSEGIRDCGQPYHRDGRCTSFGTGFAQDPAIGGPSKNEQRSEASTRLQIPRGGTNEFRCSL